MCARKTLAQTVFWDWAWSALLHVLLLAHAPPRLPERHGSAKLADEAFLLTAATVAPSSPTVIHSCCFLEVAALLRSRWARWMKRPCGIEAVHADPLKPRAPKRHSCVVEWWASLLVTFLACSLMCVVNLVTGRFVRLVVGLIRARNTLKRWLQLGARALARVREISCMYVCIYICVSMHHGHMSNAHVWFTRYNAEVHAHRI